MRPIVVFTGQKKRRIVTLITHFFTTFPEKRFYL